MFDVIALVCILGQSPQECQPPTALRQIFLSTVSNEIRCGIEGQEHLAQAANMVPQGYYAKLLCVRREDEKT